MLIGAVDAIVLSGGSGFGLDAATGAQAWLREQGRGFPIGEARIPIVPQAICFDLSNGGDKNWGRFPPYRDLAFLACEAAAGGRFALGTAGGGYGASTVTYKGGLGSASAMTSAGCIVGALAVVNALGSAVIGEGPHFWAGGLEVDGEFGGHGLPDRITAEMRRLQWKGGREHATTIAVVATDASITKAQTKRLAIAAHAGLARALRLSHALLDGDTVFAAATGKRQLENPIDDQIEIAAVAADCLARAIARGVYEATNPGPRWIGPPAYRERFP
jgi:L-aminopeptidase/D-esterase-like protein